MLITGRTATVTTTGELDLCTSEELLRQLRELVPRVDVIEIEASELSFVDSAGLHALVRARNEGEVDGVTVRVSAMSDALAQVLTMTKLHELLTA